MFLSLLGTCFENHCVLILSLRAVSYTHLDVYKRQTVTFRRFICSFRPSTIFVGDTAGRGSPFPPSSKTRGANLSSHAIFCYSVWASSLLVRHRWGARACGLTFCMWQFSNFVPRTPFQTNVHLKSSAVVLCSSCHGTVSYTHLDVYKRQYCTC